MKNFILTFFLIALSTISYPQWQMLDGPYETHGVKRLFNHPNGSLFAIGYNNLYDNNRVYRSTDFGETWVKVLSGTDQLYSLYGDSSNEVYAGGEGRIYHSSDNGENWIMKNIPQTGSAFRAISLNSSGNIFAGNSDGIFLSTNGGNNWLQVLHISTGDILILGNDDIFATSSTSGIHFSSDNGINWVSKNTDLPSLICRKIVQNSSGELFTNVLYNGIYKSTNYGLSWFLPDSSNLTNLSDLFIDKSDILYVCKWTTVGIGIPGVYRSTNDGFSWDYLGLGTQHKYDLNTVSVDNNNKLYAGNDRGLYYYSELDSTWYLGTLYRDLGYIQSFAFCDENTIYASEKLRVWKSTDLGMTWNYINDRDTPFINKGFHNRIFISPPLEFSDDCGTTWYIPNISSLNKTYFSSNEELYGGSSKYIFSSSDNGTSWNQVGISIPFVGLEKVEDLGVNSSGHIFVAQSGWIYAPPLLPQWTTTRSTDNGAFFQQIYTTKKVFAIEIDGYDNLFLGTDGVGVLKSTDNGDSWIPMNSGLTNLYINDLTYSPEGILLAATNNGVFRYSEEYNYWTHLDNSGLVSIKIHNLNYHNNILYAGTDFGIAYYTGEVPVELLSFTGVVSDRKVILNWSTATELNNYRFEIQRKISDYNWITIGFVEGNGTTTTQSNYFFLKNLETLDMLVKLVTG
jgi:photosystem II stability/assembly factor-like uncharacterized protein